MSADQSQVLSLALAQIQPPLQSMRPTVWALSTALLLMLQACVPLVAVGIGSVILVAEDRRTTGTVIEDEGIEHKVVNRIKEKYNDTVHINANSFNRIVLLSGEALNHRLRRNVGSLLDHRLGGRRWRSRRWRLFATCTD